MEEQLLEEAAKRTALRNLLGKSFLLSSGLDALDAIDKIRKEDYEGAIRSGGAALGGGVGGWGGATLGAAGGELLSPVGAVAGGIGLGTAGKLAGSELGKAGADKLIKSKVFKRLKELLKGDKKTSNQTGKDEDNSLPLPKHFFDKPTI